MKKSTTRDRGGISAPKKAAVRHEVCVVGSGYVGLVTGACLAELGHRVVCVDSDARKLSALKAGRVPIYEPGLEELFRRNVKLGRLRFAPSVKEGMGPKGRRAKVIFIAVGTPPRADGSADLSAVEKVAEEIARNLAEYTVIVDKSTVPVETGEWVSKTVARFNKREIPYDVVSNPEFLSEGSAVKDFLNPDRVVLGVTSARAEKTMRELYAPLDAPVLVTDVKSAELIKHASNSFLATKISFINAVSILCEKVGADVAQVAHGMGLDRRIGPMFLRAGIGFGGFCLHPDEPVLLRDPAGMIRTMPIGRAHEALGRDRGAWEALSFDPDSGRMSFMPVTAVSRRPFDGLMVRVSTKMGKSVRVTSDHPMLLRSGEGWALRPAADLTTKDWLPCYLTMPSSPAALKVDLIENLKIQRPDYFDRVLVRPRTGAWSLSEPARRALSSMNPRKHHRTHDIARRGGPLRLPEFLELESRGLLRVPRSGIALATAKGDSTYVPAVIELTPEFCRLLGYLAAEGCLVAESGLRGVRERAAIHFHEKETEYRDDVTSILDGLGIKHDLVHVPQHKTRRIIVSSRLFAFLLRDVLGCGRDSYTARVPDMVMTSPAAQRSAFLIGSLRGDGSLYFSKASPAVTCEFGTASPAMADGMTTLCHSLGLVPSRKAAFQNKSTVPAHFLKISGAPQVRRIADAKGTAAAVKVRSRLALLKREPQPAGFKKISDDAAMVRVTGLERESYQGMVYSLEVSGNETFAGPSGLVMHNCFPKDLEAFYWISRQKGYDFKLLTAVKEINEHQKAWVQRKIEEKLWNLEGKTVALLGLAFKPHTDDMRFAPSVDIARMLLERGVKVRACDPVAQERARQIPELKPVRLCRDAYDCARGADALVLVTEWPQYKDLDLKRLRALMRNPLILDGRNLYDPAAMRQAGFAYCGVGRPEPS